MSINDHVLAEIVACIRAASKVESIILFGSAAEGRMTPDSDVDLLIIEGRPEDLRKEGYRLRAALRGLGFPFDVVVMSRDRFEETKHVIGGLAFPAHKYGRILYEAT